MTALFLFLLPALAGIAMATWMSQARRAGGYRWIGHWLASLLPVGLLLASLPFAARVPDLLFMGLLSMGAAGAAAFVAGGLYLLLSAAPVQAAGAAAVEGFREAVNSPSSSDDSRDWGEDDTRFISEAHRREVEIYGEHAYYGYGEYYDE